ncbi:TPA: MFS transporter, partial [Pseudomonas putida]|nr:MFS transporter [Pseudomonas putida]
AMASLGAANAVGLVVGPALAALLARHSLSLPFHIMSLLPATAFLVLFFTLKPQALPHSHAPSPVRLNDPRLRRPLLVAFSAMLSVTVSQIIVGFFALDRLHLGPAEAAQAAGIALTTVGVALMLAQVILRQLEWPPLKMIRVGATVSALGFACGSLATTAPWLWACYFVAAAGMGFVFPAFSALAANAMQASEQGATAGSIGAAQGMGAVIGPLAGTLVYALDPRLPFLAVAVLLLLVGLWPMPRERRV